MKTLTGSKKLLLILSLLLYIAAFVASIIHADGAFLVLSVLTIASSLFLGILSIKEVTRYRMPVVGFFLAMALFALGEVMILFHGAPFRVPMHGVAENIHGLVGLVIGVSIAIYVTIDFSRREITRIVMDVFLIAVLVGVTMRSTIRNALIISMGEDYHFDYSSVVFFIAPIFIFAVLIMIVSLRAPFVHPWSSYVVLISLLIYAGCDLYHAYHRVLDSSVDINHIGILYLFCYLLLAIATLDPAMKNTTPTTEGEFNQKLSLALGWLFGFGSMAVSFIFYLLKLIDDKSLFVILVAAMAYLLMWKTQQAYELQKQLLEKVRVENERKEKELVYAQAEKDALSRQLEESTLIDNLTGLYNRNYIPVYLEQLMEDNYEKSVTFFSVDINYFKSVNEAYGYGVGDLALMEVARRLSGFSTYEKEAIRAGGDEFLLILRGIPNYDEINVLAENLAQALDNPIEIHGVRFHLIANIGIASYPWDTMNIYEMINYAEIARGSIKHTSRKTAYAHYDMEIAPKMNRMRQIERRLQEVDFAESFQMYYQPQVNAADGKLIGMEALVRWNDKKLGFVSPAEFISMAEEMGIMIPMGEWISRVSIQQIKTWNERYHTNHTMGINVSPVQMRDPEFAAKFLSVQDALDVPTQWLDIELTEGVATNLTFYNNENLKTLRKEGLTFSIDDFGTGYASFANMVVFDYDRLKIAKELIDNLVTNENARVIVESIIFMAKGMHMHTIAEGVEDEAQLKILRELGCEQIQGYYFGRPLPAEDFEKVWFDRSK